MSTENMPTTNQSPEEATFADKIPLQQQRDLSRAQVWRQMLPEAR